MKNATFLRSIVTEVIKLLNRLLPSISRMYIIAARHNREFSIFFLFAYIELFFRLDTLRCVFCIREPMYRFMAMWDSMGSLESLPDFIVYDMDFKCAKSTSENRRYLILAVFLLVFCTWICTVQALLSFLLSTISILVYCIISFKFYCAYTLCRFNLIYFINFMKILFYFVLTVNIIHFRRSIYKTEVTRAKIQFKMQNNIF